jgi:hypothetical protein
MDGTAETDSLAVAIIGGLEEANEETEVDAPLS